MIFDAEKSPKGERTSLTTRLVVLLSIPIVLQLLLTASLWVLRTSADTIAINAGLAREISSAVHVVVSNSLTITDIANRSMRRGLLRESNWESPLSKVKLWCDWLCVSSGSSEISETARTIQKQTETLALMIRQSWIVNQQEIRISGHAKYQPVDLQPKVTQLETEIRDNLLKLQKLQKDHAVQLTSQEISPLQYFLFSSLLWGIVLNLIGLASLGIVFSKDIIARLATVQETVVGIQRRRKLPPSMPGSDEIAQLDRSFHNMALMMRRVEEKQRTFFDHAYNVLCSIDTNRRFLEINQASAKVLGYRPTEMVGKSIETFVAASDRQAVVTTLERICSGSTPQLQASFELTMTRRDGSPLETLWTTSQTQNRNNIFCVLHDISERKAAQKMRREMVQMVSHDLRSPLTSLGVVYSMLKTGNFGQLNEQGLKLLAAAEANSARMLRLINDLLDIEKLEANMLQLEKTPTDLSVLIDQSIESVSLLANQKQITITNTANYAVSGAILIVNVDPHRIVQVLVNLLSNAIKFSPVGGKIVVGLQTNQSKKSLQISVSDEGRGIPPHLIKEVFNRFQQVQSSDATHKGGSGLGLAICKSLVELHNGEISVQSQLNQGSTFIVQLPM